MHDVANLNSNVTDLLRRLDAWKARGNMSLTLVSNSARANSRADNPGCHVRFENADQ